MCNTYRKIPEPKPHLRVSLHKNPPEHVSHDDYPIFDSLVRLTSKLFRHFLHFVTFSRKNFTAWLTVSIRIHNRQSHDRDRLIKISISTSLFREITTRTRCAVKTRYRIRSSNVTFPPKSSLWSFNNWYDICFEHDFRDSTMKRVQKIRHVYSYALIRGNNTLRVRIEATNLKLHTVR